ncbi:MAG: translocation/assembly module TamB domain-containing protein, partial [Myxococcales bacterium]|nr:translocation/assembly module TamB domain-containing protein [Myxococcales bacterium]
LGGQLVADLAVGRTNALPLRGAITLRELDFGRILSEATSNEDLRGKTSGQILFTDGSALGPVGLSGAVELAQFSIGSDGFVMSSAEPLKLNLDQGDIHVERFRLQSDLSEVEIAGSRTAAGQLQFRISGGMDVALLATLAPRLTHAEGRVGLQIKLGGTTDAPSLFGKAEVSGVAFRYAGFPVPLSKVDGTVIFSERSIVLENFGGEIAGGQVGLSGSATFSERGVDQYEFSLQGDNLTFQPEVGVEVTAGGRLKLHWTPSRRLPVLDGTLRLDRVRYARPIQLLQNLSLSELSRDQQTTTRSDPEDDLVELNLRLVQGGPLSIVNNIVDAELQIEDSEKPFFIVGTDKRVGVVGTLLVPRGTVLFRNANFDIRRGIIDFNDPTRINPHFDLLATTELRRSAGFTGPNWRVSLHATGNQNAFRLNMSSEPALSQEDVMLLLTMGMTRAEAERLQASDVTSSAALEALATVTGINREVRRAVPVIDDFRLSSQYSRRTNQTEPQVTVGKRLTDDVRLSASTGLSDARELRTAVEWQLDNHTAVQAAYDNVSTSTASGVGNVGVDIRWRLEFE